MASERPSHSTPPDHVNPGAAGPVPKGFGKSIQTQFWMAQLTSFSIGDGKKIICYMDMKRCCATRAHNFSNCGVVLAKYSLFFFKESLPVNRTLLRVKFFQFFNFCHWHLKELKSEWQIPDE